jgi:hypothetical protein
MGEQQKISIIRFKKMLPDGDFSFLKVSQITTHVLDTSTGIPGAAISIRLQALEITFGKRLHKALPITTVGFPIYYHKIKI